MSTVSRFSLVVAMGLALGACGNEQPAEDVTAPAATTATPAAAPAATPETAVSEELQALSSEDLRDAARKAYSDNRLYAPAGDNAVEYFLALRDKSPADAGVSSALTDLLPMTVIATEQSISREDFAEAQRLAALLEKAEPEHPALARLKSSIDTRQQEVAARAARQEVTAEEQLARQADLERQRLADQKQQQEAAAKALLAKQAADDNAENTAAQQAATAAEQAAEQRKAEEAKAAAAAQVKAAAKPTAADLRPLSTPAPEYPRAAFRAGTSGEVQVEFIVGVNGSVSSARVIHSQPRRIFDRAALEAVERWRFQPLPAPVTTRRTIGFSPAGG
ncbi:energy transducer TonB [Lysobacter sp. A289]